MAGPEEELFPGVVLPPYWLQLVSALLFLLGGYLFSLCAHCRKPKGQRPPHWVMLAKPNPLWCGLQAAKHCANFVYICVDVTWAATHPLRGWQAYEAIHARFLVSGVTNLLGALGLAERTVAWAAPPTSWGYWDGDELAPLADSMTAPTGRDRRYSRLSVVIAFLVLSPALTHILPMLLVYYWVFVGQRIAARVCAFAMLGRCPTWQPWWHVFLPLLYPIDERHAVARRLLMALSAPVFSTFFLYGVLRYRGERYIDVVVREFELRDTRRYVEALRAAAEHRLDDAAGFWHVALGLLTNLL